MTENCDLGKWRLLIKHVEKRKSIEFMVVGTACVAFLMFIFFAGKGVEKGTQILTEKILMRYVENAQIP